MFDELKEYVQSTLDDLRSHTFCDGSALELTGYEKGRISSYEDILDYLSSNDCDDIDCDISHSCLLMRCISVVEFVCNTNVLVLDYAKKRGKVEEIQYYMGYRNALSSFLSILKGLHDEMFGSDDGNEI